MLVLFYNQKSVGSLSYKNPKHFYIYKNLLFQASCSGNANNKISL